MQNKEKIPRLSFLIKRLYILCTFLWTSLWTLLLSALLMLLTSTRFALAESTTSGLDFSLQLSRIDLRLEAAGITYPVDLKRINVLMFEESPTNIDLGLMLGNSYLSLEQDGPSAGLSLNGFHLGLIGRRAFGNNPRFNLQGHILYQKLQDVTPSTTVTLDWFEWQLASSLRLALNRDWGLILGAGYTGIDADRRVSGSINQTLGMSLKKPLHGELGIEMLSAGGGRVRLTGYGGGQQGLSLDFARRF